MDSSLIEIKGVRGYIDSNEVIHLNLEDIARGLGFTTVATSGNECVRWNRVKGHLVNFGLLKSADDEAPEFIEEPYFYWLAMKAGNKTAEAFQKKVCFEILPEIRRHGGYRVPGRGYASIQAVKAGTGIINTLERIMIAQHCTPYEIAQMAENICLIYRIPIPPNFVKEDPQIRFSNTLQITRMETTTTSVEVKG